MRPALRVLAATWAGLKTLAGGRVRWFAPWFAGAAIQGTNAVAQSLEGQWAFGFTSALFAAMLALWPVTARYEFREAWADGYVEGALGLGDALRGTTPAPLLRAATTGHLAPEPWDRVAPPPDTTTKGEMP